MHCLFRPWDAADGRLEEDLALRVHRCEEDDRLSLDNKCHDNFASWLEPEASHRDARRVGRIYGIENAALVGDDPQEWYERSPARAVGDAVARIQEDLAVGSADRLPVLTATKLDVGAAAERRRCRCEDGRRDYRR